MSISAPFLITMQKEIARINQSLRFLHIFRNADIKMHHLLFHFFDGIYIVNDISVLNHSQASYLSGPGVLAILAVIAVVRLNQKMQTPQFHSA